MQGLWIQDVSWESLAKETQVECASTESASASRAGTAQRVTSSAACPNSMWHDC